MEQTEPQQASRQSSDEQPQRYAMVAKTFQGLEDILADEIRALPGAENVEPGRRMVSFDGTLETMYRANMQCRTALRILKPLCSFTASDPDDLYSRAKEFDWGSVLSLDTTFSIDSGAVYSDEFTNSLYVTYRVKDAITDWFQDRYGAGCRPGVRLQDADIRVNVHISGSDVTLSLDSSGESLHKRGYRVAQTEAPINEVLAAGIILRSGWRGDQPFVDPMCGSGTFLVEAALIAAGIMPGIYRSKFAFETWPDYDRELFEEIYNDDSAERTPAFGIYGADKDATAVAIAARNIKEAGVGKYITLERRDIADWDAAPEEGIPGVLVTNPPYGERISADNMEELYATIGTKLKRVFRSYHAWIIGYRDEYFAKIGLSASLKLPVLNGKLECELREYIIFDGDMKSFKAAGGSTASEARRPEKPRGKKGSWGKEDGAERRLKEQGKWKKDGRKFDGDRKPRFDKDRRFGDSDRKPRFDKDRKFDRGDRKFDGERKPRPERRDNDRPFDREAESRERRHQEAQRIIDRLTGKSAPRKPSIGGGNDTPRRGWKRKS